MTIDHGELSALKDTLQAAELEVSRLRRELTDTTTELRVQRGEANKYRGQFAKTSDVLARLCEDYNDLMVKNEKLKRHSPVIAYLGEDGTWSDQLQLAMHFGEQLAESHEGVQLYNVGIALDLDDYQQRLDLAMAFGRELAELTDADIGMIALRRICHTDAIETPDPKQAAPVACWQCGFRGDFVETLDTVKCAICGVDQSRPVGQDGGE